jgi:hypothetical protein
VKVSRTFSDTLTGLAESTVSIPSQLQPFQQSEAGVKALRKSLAFIERPARSLGDRVQFKYCASNARSAAATVGPIPTIPCSRLAPSNAIQRSPRKDN